MIKRLIERFEARETKIGKFLAYVAGVLFMAISSIGQYAESLGAIPHDWIPMWLKGLIVVCSVFSFVIGKFTEDKSQPTNPS